jgi:hypothetical protein
MKVMPLHARSIATDMFRDLGDFKSIGFCQFVRGAANREATGVTEDTSSGEIPFSRPTLLAWQYRSSAMFHLA